MRPHGWKSLRDELAPPRFFKGDSQGWYRFAIVSDQSGAPIGLRKLKRLRSAAPRERMAAAVDFAEKLAEALPTGAVAAFMPSSTRPSIGADQTSILYLVRGALTTLRSDVDMIEPLIRQTPVPSVHEDRTHDVELLKSTLKATAVSVRSDVLYVIDDMVATGATYAAFSAAFHDHWPQVETVLLAYVYSPKRPKLFV